MTKTAKTPEATRLLFNSPYTLLIFLAVPAITVISHLKHLPYPKNLLLFNNGCFMLLCALRCGWYLLRLGVDLRYAPDCCRPRRAVELQLTAAALRTRLAAAGFRFDAGGYGERRDAGYHGSVLFYAGLALALMVGTYDNARQYSASAVTGFGNAVPFVQAVVSGKGHQPTSSSLPQLQVKKQIFGDPQYPNGATEIALVDRADQVLASGITAPGKPLRYDGVNYEMVRFLFDVNVGVVPTKGPALGGVIRLRPMPVKQGGYDYYGSIPNKEITGIHGDAWYNPEKQALRLLLTLDGKEIFDDYLQTLTRTSVTRGGYDFKLAKLGQWSEISAERVRHFALVKTGAVIALAGLLLRLLFRPQRVWLEESDGVCRAWAVGHRTRQLLTGK